MASPDKGTDASVSSAITSNGKYAWENVPSFTENITISLKDKTATPV
jgi:hypothetical protein